METGVEKHRRLEFVPPAARKVENLVWLSSFCLDCRHQNYPAFKVELPTTDGYDAAHSAHIPLAQFREYPELMTSLLRFAPENDKYSTMRCGFIFGDFNDAMCEKRWFTLKSPRLATHALMLVWEKDLQKLGFQPSDNIVADYQDGSLEAAWHKYIDLRFAETPIDQSSSPAHLSLLDCLMHGWCVASICLKGLEVLKFPHIPCDDNRYLPAFPPEYPNRLLREQCYYEWCSYFFPDRVQVM